jgi:hypothetical protein
MRTRRTFLMSLTCAAVGLGLVVVPALATQLIGRITKVDVEAKKLHVVGRDRDIGKERGGRVDSDVTVTDDTIFMSVKGGEERKLDLERLKRGIEKSERGFPAVIQHEKGVASKIRLMDPRDIIPPKQSDSPKDE